MELVRRADTAAFIQCHVNAFEYLGDVPQSILYDNAKVVTLGRDEDKQPIWNQRMLDLALRVGIEIRVVPALPGPDQAACLRRAQMDLLEADIAAHLLALRQVQALGGSDWRRKQLSGALWAATD